MAKVCQSKTSQPSRLLKPMRTFHANDETYGDSNGDNTTAEDDVANLIHMEVTPHLKATVIHDKGSFRFDVFPDLGGVACLISHDLVQKHNLVLRRLMNLPKFQAINGKLLTVDGVVCVMVQNENNLVEIPITAIVSSDVSNKILIGYQALKELHVISRKFPISKFVCKDDLLHMKNQLCLDYSNVIRDTLLDSPMCSNPM